MGDNESKGLCLCPFCGGRSSVEKPERLHHGIVYRVGCAKKGCPSWVRESVMYTSYDAAVEAWNHREGAVKRFDYEAKYDGDDIWERRFAHHVYDADNGEEVYHVADLAGYFPEDATVDRDLMSAEDWIKIVNYGIELGRDGYGKAELFKLGEPED